MFCRSLLLFGLITTLAASLVQAATPEVTNIRASQRAGTKLIDIYYDLADSDSASVFISIQLYDNTTPLPSFAVTGDVGIGVTPGANKLLTWNAGQDWNRRYTTKGTVRIIADDLTTTPPSATMAYVPAGFGKPEGSNYDIYTSGFFMDKTEVSQALWSSVYTWAIANGYSFDNAGVALDGTHPIAGLSWYDAVKWCNARSQKDGLTPVYYTDNTLATVYKTGQVVLNNDTASWTANGYRLPTRAEWIKAYWGGNTSGFYPWPSYGGAASDNIHGGMANYLSSGAPFYIPGGGGTTMSTNAGSFSLNTVTTTPVGYYNGTQTPQGPDNKNGFGLYDMAGNVGEWCWDRSYSGWYSLTEARDDNSAGPTQGLGTTRCFSGQYSYSTNYNAFRGQPYTAIDGIYYYPYQYAHKSSSEYTAVGLRTVRSR